MKKLLILFCLIIIQVQGQVDVTQDPRILNLLNQNKFNPKYRNQQQDASNPHYSSRITVRGKEYGAYGKVRDFKQVNQNVVRVLNSTITGGGFVQEQVGIATAYRYTMPVTNKNHSRYLSQLARNYGKVSRKKTITYKEGFSSEIENSASTLVYKPNYKVVTKHVYNPNKKGSRGFVDTTMQLKGVVTRTVYTGTCPVGRGHIVNEEVAREDYNLHKAQTSYNELLIQNKIHEAKYLNQYFHNNQRYLRNQNGIEIDAQYKKRLSSFLWMYRSLVEEKERHLLKIYELKKKGDWDKLSDKKREKYLDEHHKRLYVQNFVFDLISRMSKNTFSICTLDDMVKKFKNGIGEVKWKINTIDNAQKAVEIITSKKIDIKLDKIKSGLGQFQKIFSAYDKANKVEDFYASNDIRRFGLILDTVSQVKGLDALGLTAYFNFFSTAYNASVKNITNIGLQRADTFLRTFISAKGNRTLYNSFKYPDNAPALHNAIRVYSEVLDVKFDVDRLNNKKK